jgi:DNA (cytosine-5)-methyltransferase 1
MKILNLYAGVGGNRKNWGEEHEITAVENVNYIADVYAALYPDDTLVREDAHQYLLDHFKEFDFIWSSPPCPTHSKLNTALAGWDIHRYPDMGLYQEVLFLKHFFKGKWVVENVEPYYAVLLQPTTFFNRHCFWSNFSIPVLGGADTQMSRDNSKESISEKLGIELPRWAKNQRKLLRNAVNPEIGAYILRQAMCEPKQTALL